MRTMIEMATASAIEAKRQGHDDWARFWLAYLMLVATVAVEGT